MNHSPEATHDKPLATHCLKVLMVTGIFPPDIGGPATYVPTMASELVQRGHKVTVVTLSDRLDHDDRSYNFPVHRIRRGRFKPLRFLFTVLGILREGRSAQVLYVNGLYLEAVIANYLLRKPMVQKIVGDWAWERATNKGWVKDTFEEFQKRGYGLKVEFLKTLRSICIRRADAVIVPSQYLASAVTHWGVSETNTSVIYNAVELPSAISSAIPLSTRFKVVTVGRLVPWKQIDRLIEALSECDEAGLVIVGDGPERSRLEALARQRQLADRVYFAGQRSKEETFGLMSACDLFVLNSTYEGFPHVVLEAMGAGLPVVATEVGGTPELVRDGENGLLISPNANGALSKTLLKLLSSSKERQRLATGAHETTQRFRRSAMIEATEAILRGRAF
jgi:glycosyltransferase involved in cell wall biosynthesis